MLPQEMEKACKFKLRPSTDRLVFTLLSEISPQGTFFFFYDFHFLLHQSTLASFPPQGCRRLRVPTAAQLGLSLATD
jgi:hypothetical protein